MCIRDRRYIFKSPSTVSEELISYSFAWMSMFAASYIFGKRDHMLSLIHIYGNIGLVIDSLANIAPASPAPYINALVSET